MEKLKYNQLQPCVFCIVTAILYIQILLTSILPFIPLFDRIYFPYKNNGVTDYIITATPLHIFILFLAHRNMCPYKADFVCHKSDTSKYSYCPLLSHPFFLIVSLIHSYYIPYNLFYPIP